MIKERFKKNPILYTFILVSIGIFVYFKWLESLPQDYSIGEVFNVYKPLKGGKVAQFKYRVDGIEYNQSVGISGYYNLVKEGTRFSVEYPEDHTGEGVMLLDHPVPDGIEAPPGGWDEKPVFKKR
ncbi:hypothetical protein SAMN05421640_1173 [Ekhidna lutea]|uniref:DUF3592 domain-containing protein n=1 Tax=Ekhidna lutea TaxID=447679 RepID=A0A239H6Z7_EKHLU|nr:hypothetical protein [Ekhidna lutea]SNS77189.1 hypothetical protein SAMN05421640_1173 [Ekhidna lutea]